MSESVSEFSLNLETVAFHRQAQELAEFGALSVSTFRYRSGVAALRLRNGVGELIVLPFHGQQIWDATFHGRRLTMRSIFPEPDETSEYLANYGGFLLHCGALGMGNPGPTDTHPVHGELPHATFQQAWLTFGRDEIGRRCVTLSGAYQHRVAFGANYRFSPSLRVTENTGRLKLDVSVKNMRAKAMELMYLAHINFRPIDGARIIDTVPNTSQSIRLRGLAPDFPEPSAVYKNLVLEIARDPGAHRHVEPGRAVDPELVFGLDCAADQSGWAHALQLLPDGSADFVSHRPDEFPRAVRWITRNGDEDALALMLPATAEADGKTAEAKKGNLILLAPDQEFRGTIEFGALTAAEVQSPPFRSML